MESLQNQTAIITGGASGMGAATARMLAKAKANIGILDMNENAAEALASELREAGVRAIALKCDVSDSKEAEKAIATVKETLGNLRICINCAGIAPGKRIIGREGVMPLEDFSKVINVNLIGNFNIMRLVANEMSQLEPMNADGERGVIINTASIAAYEGQIGQVAYSAAKGGIVGMTLAAARDLAKFGIRVMTIAPGIMATPMMEAMPENVQVSLAEQMPFPKRLGAATEYAKLALHIIENTYLNGEVIRLDAAIRMQPK